MALVCEMFLRNSALNSADAAPALFISLLLLFLVCFLVVRTQNIIATVARIVGRNVRHKRRAMTASHFNDCVFRKASKGCVKKTFQWIKSIFFCAMPSNNSPLCEKRASFMYARIDHGNVLDFRPFFFLFLFWNNRQRLVMVRFLEQRVQTASRLKEAMHTKATVLGEQNTPVVRVLEI